MEEEEDRSDDSLSTKSSRVLATANTPTIHSAQHHHDHHYGTQRHQHHQSSVRAGSTRRSSRGISAVSWVNSYFSKSNEFKMTHQAAQAIGGHYFHTRCPFFCFPGLDFSVVSRFYFCDGRTDRCTDVRTPHVKIMTTFSAFFATFLAD